MNNLNEVFEALANEHRREMILALALQPMSISELAERRELSLPAIHKHVRVLEGAGLVQRRKAGRTNYLSLKRDPLTRLQAWTDQFNPWWGNDGETLENYQDRLNDSATKKE